MSLLTASGITKDYKSKDSDSILRVLDNVSISIPKSHIIGITGSSGCGKSTLLHIIGGLDRPTSGSVFFDEINISTLNDQALAEFRNKRIGFIFQFHYLLPEFTALENVMMPALINKQSTTEIKENASNILNELGMSDRLQHRPSELSGGEQQRVAIARSLINNPDLILADEPTGNLDENNTRIVLEMLIHLTKERNKSLLIVTHDKTIANRCDTRFEIKNKTIHTLS